VRPTPENPFREATFSELTAALYEATRALEQRPLRTRADKERFAERLRFLLLAVASRFWNGPTIPGSPEMDLTNAIAPDVERAFMTWYAREVRTAPSRTRVVTIYRAADFVLGKRGAHWVMPHTFMPNALRPLDHASHSEENLRVCLRELGRMLHQSQ
jgi:hypothetical protein